MDNIKRVLPIRSYKLRNPIVIAFNIHLTHFNAFGTRHYDRLARSLMQHAQVQKRKVILLPNITNLEQSIESRGETLSSTLKHMLKQTGHEKCHLVAHSFTGVDARAAISLFGAHTHVQSLTTICTPHLGMKLIDEIHSTDK